MGNIFSRDEITENKAEKLLLNVLESLKLTHYGVNTLKESFNCFDIVEEDSSRIVHIIDEDKYNEALERYWVNNNSNEVIDALQRSFIPEFTLISEKTPDYIYFTFGIGLTTNNNSKSSFIVEMLSSNISNIVCNYGSFCEFIHFYLDIVFLKFTIRFENVLKDFMNKSLFEITINDQIMQELNELKMKIYDINNIDIFFQEIKKSLFDILYENNKVDLKDDISSFELNENDINKLLEAFPFLFDIFHLRYYFYNRFK